MGQTAEVITALGGLSGLSAVIASIATLVQARRIREEVGTNHGSSIADAVTRTNVKTEEATDRMANRIYADCEAVSLTPGDASLDEIVTVLDAIDPDRAAKYLND